MKEVSPVRSSGGVGFCSILSAGGRSEGTPCLPFVLSLPRGDLLWGLTRMSGLSFRRRVGLIGVGALFFALVLPLTAASAGTSAKAIPAQGSKTVTINPKLVWNDTGASVQSGGFVNLNASGLINVRNGNPGFSNSPAGQSSADPGCIAGPTTYGPGWTANGLPCWSLIGKIGQNGTPFAVGNSLTYTVPNGVSGELYLGINDNYFPDNSGSWTVVITGFFCIIGPGGTCPPGTAG